MKSQLTFTPEVLTLYNHCDYYYLSMLNILAMFCYNLYPAQPEEDWPPLIAWFLSRFLPRFWPFQGVFPSHRALHLHCLVFGVLVWGSVQHFVTSADVRRAL